MGVRGSGLRVRLTRQRPEHPELSPSRWLTAHLSCCLHRAHARWATSGTPTFPHPLALGQHSCLLQLINLASVLSPIKWAWGSDEKIKSHPCYIWWNRSKETRFFFPECITQLVILLSSEVWEWKWIQSTRAPEMTQKLHKLEDLSDPTKRWEGRTRSIQLPSDLPSAWWPPSPLNIHAIINLKKNKQTRKWLCILIKILLYSVS